MSNKHVTFHCDNKSVTEIINKQSSKQKTIMVLVRHLVLTCMQYNIVFKAQHIEGCRNVLPDRLSRQFQVSAQLLEEYGMHPKPVAVPSYLRPTAFKEL